MAKDEAGSWGRHAIGIAVAICCALANATPAAATPAGNAYITPQGDGFQADGRPQPPLTRLWTRDHLPKLPAAASPPVSAGGRVFVLTQEPIGFVRRLRALDLATGRALWERMVSSIDGRLAADEDTVVVTSEGFQAFESASGETRWVADDGVTQARGVSPVIDGGLLLTTGDGAGLVARSAATGAIRWTGPPATAAPAVTGDRIVINDGCGTSALDRADGAVVWGPIAGAAPCPNGVRVAVHGGRVFVAGALPGADSGSGDDRLQILDLADGAQLGRPLVPLAHTGPGSVTEETRPAVAGSVMYAAEVGAVTARDVPSGDVLWQAPLDLAQRTVAVSGATVYATTLDSVVALNRATGAQTWSAPDPADGFASTVLATDGVLLTAGGHGLTAWSDAPAGPALPAVAPGGPAPAPARPGSDARTLGQSPARDGVLDTPGGLAAPLARRWQRDPGGSIIYGPLTQGDLAYVVTTSPSPGKRTVVEAFDIQTGASRWRRAVFSRVFAGGARLAAGGGVVVAMLDRVTMEAFDAVSGASRWRREISNQGGDSMIVDAGRVFTMLASPRRIAAYDLDSGAPLWEREVSMPVNAALSSDGETVYAGTECGFGAAVAAVAADDGTLRWRRGHANFICRFGTLREPAPIVHGSELLTDEGAVRRRSDGAILDRIAGGGRVAAAGRTRIGVDDGRLQATDTRGRLQWITREPGFGEGYYDRPIIAGPQLFVAGMRRGRIEARALADGDLLWSDAPFDEFSPPLLTARPGTLFAAAGEQLVAYGPATAGPVLRLNTMASPTQERRPPVSWTVDGALMTTCGVDGAPASPCVSGFAPPSDLADGEHTITVSATGLGGTTSETAIVRVDNTGPAVTITGGPPPFTNAIVTHPMQFSVDEPGVRVECRLDGQLIDADCHEEPFFNATADGPHEASITAIDEVGNVGEPAIHRWTIDRGKPVVTIGKAPADRSNVASPEIEFTFDEPVTQVTCNGLPCSSPATLGPFPDGRWSITVRATDRAENEGQATVSFTVDTTAPGARIDAGPPQLTNEASAELSFAGLAPAESLECRLDGGPWETCTSPRTVSTPADGEHRFAVRAVDDLGNRGALAEHVWTVDRTPPVLTLVAGPSTFSNTDSPRFVLSASEQGTLDCTLNGAASPACESFTALPDGPYTLAWELRDRAGNVGTVPPPYSWTIDTRTPTLTISSGPPPRTRDRSASFVYSADEAAVTFTCSDTITVRDPCPQPLELTGLADGSQRVTITVTDRAGNAMQLDRYWIVDSTGPNVTIFAPGTHFGDRADLEFRVDSDAVGVQCTVDERPPVACAAPVLRVTGLQPGTHRFAISAADELGNVGPQAQSSWVQLAAPAAPALPPPPAPARPPLTGSQPANAGALSKQAVDRLRRDARSTVRRLARRGRSRLAKVRTLTFRSTLPRAGRLTASLRVRGRTVAAGRLTLTRAGTFRLRLKTTAAGRRALRRARGRLELRVSFAPAGGRRVQVRASAPPARR